MPNDESVGGVHTDVAGGESESQVDGSSNNSGESTSEAQSVSWKSHRKALDELHRAKRRLQELDAKLGDVEEARLREQEDYKGLADKYKTEAEKWKEKATHAIGTSINTHKAQEIRRLALQAGLREDALSHLDLLPSDEVEVDVTANGQYIVQGAEQFVSNLKQKSPFLFKQTDKSRVNPGGGAVPPKGQPLTPGDVAEAERSYKQGRITRAAYEKVYFDYVRQGKTSS